MKFIKNLFITISSIVLLILIWASILKGDIFNIFAGILFLIIILVFSFLSGNKVKKPIPKHIVIEKYKELMEDKYGISLTSNAILYRDEQTPEDYVMVLKDIDTDNNNMTRYFTFECNKFDLLFGRGTGSIKYKIAEVINWLHQNTRINLKPELYIDWSERAKLNTLKDMEYNNDYRGGEFASE